MNILLVEDDAGIGRFVRRGLAQRGYEVVLERDGRRTEELLRAGEFSALILDRALPDCDGLELCRQLRDAAIQVPIIMLTARGTLQDRLDGFASGADDYLPKPFAFEELLARLSAVVRRSPNLRPEPVSFGTLALEPGTRTARVDGQALPLSPREFDLLLELARAGGGIVSRERLLTAVWGREVDVTDNALDVYVGYLRRRLASAGGAPLIETHRRQGFRLAAPSAAPDPRARPAKEG